MFLLRSFQGLRQRSLSTTTTARAQNPLLHFKHLPRFTEINPSEHIKPAVTKSLADLATAFENVEANLPTQKNARDIYNLAVDDLERAAAPLSFSWGVTNHLMGVKNSPELRESHETLQPLVINQIQHQSQSAVVFEALQRCVSAPDFQDLEPAQQRIVAASLQSMEHAGVGLPSADATRFNAIQQELGNLQTQFTNNVLDSTKEFRMDFHSTEGRKQLVGLPPTALALASSMYTPTEEGETNSTSTGAEHGPWTLTLDMTSLLPALQHLENRDLREKLYRASRAIASSPPFDNTPLVTKILMLRQEMASMLGMNSYAEVSLATKMADSVEAVSDLSEMLRDRCLPAAKDEMKELQQYAAEEHGLNSQLELWDVPFYSERLREHRFSFTDEDVRPYFALPNVLNGLFKLATTLFEIHIVEQQM